MYTFWSVSELVVFVMQQVTNTPQFDGAGDFGFPDLFAWNDLDQEDIGQLISEISNDNNGSGVQTGNDATSSLSGDTKKVSDHLIADKKEFSAFSTPHRIVSFFNEFLWHYYPTFLQKCEKTFRNLVIIYLKITLN